MRAIGASSNTSSNRASWKYLRATWKVFAGTVALIVTVLGVYEVLVPRASVFAGEPLNPSSVLTAPFVLVNEGYLSIYSVEFGCRPNLFRFSNGIVMDGAVWSLTVIPRCPRYNPQKKKHLIANR